VHNERRRGPRPGRHDAAAGVGLGTTIKYLRGTAGIGLGTTIKHLRRPARGVAGDGPDTTTKYLFGAVGIGLGNTKNTFNAQRAPQKVELAVCEVQCGSLKNSDE
jgi:hypothetical protein